MSDATTPEAEKLYQAIYDDFIKVQGLDRDAAHESTISIMEAIRAFIDQYAALEAERDGYEERWARAVSSRQHTQQWYSERLERLKDLCKEFGCWDQAAAIIANGTPNVTDGSIYEPPTYAQQLNAARHRATAAEDKALALASRLADAERLLKPFAKAAEAWGDIADDDVALEFRVQHPAVSDEPDCTLGDLRAASTFLRSEDNG